MNINFRPLSKLDKNYVEIIALYKEAFPDARHIPTWFLQYKLRKGKQGFDIIYADNTWVGLIYIIEHKGVLFVQFFAVAESYRSSGYGSQVINTLMTRNVEKRIILNIQPLDPQTKNYEQRVKRKSFYLKNGFKSSGYLVKEPGEQLEMLIWGGDIDKQEIEAIYNNMFGGVLGFLLRPKVLKS